MLDLGVKKHNSNKKLIKMRSDLSSDKRTSEKSKQSIIDTTLDETKQRNGYLNKDLLSSSDRNRPKRDQININIKRSEPELHSLQPKKKL